MRPKGKRGRAAVRRLGRRYKTGGFAKIARKAARRYGKARAKKIAGAIYWKMVRKHRRK